MPKLDKLRVAIDTNLIVSGIIIAKTLPDQLLRAWQKDLYILVVSTEIIEEVRSVLHRDYIKQRYQVTDEKITQLVTALKVSAELVSPLPAQDLPIYCRDAKDNKLLGLALSADVDYLITGDNDLLVLNGRKELGRLKIITVRDFLSLI